MPTDYHECKDCHTRLLIVRDIPPLNWARDPAGRVAVTFTHPITGRWLARDEPPTGFEHTYGVHECAEVAALPEVAG